MPLVHRCLKGIRIATGFLLLCAAFSATVPTAEVAERSYSYDAIEFDIAVNADTGASGGGGLAGGGDGGGGGGAS